VKFSLSEENGTLQLGRKILACDCKEGTAISRGTVSFQRGKERFPSKRWISVFGCSDSYDLLAHSAEREGLRICDFSSQAI
jgi:hypothetical protein